MSNDCIATIVEAGGGKLSREEARDILDRVEIFRRKAAADPVRAEERLAELIAQDAEREKIKAALARKHAAINVRVRDRLDTALTRLKAGGYSPGEALRVVMRGGNRRVEGVRASVAATQSAFEARYLGAVLGKIAAERPEVERLLSGRWLGLSRAETVAFGERVAREIWALGEGKQNVSGDPAAAWLGKVLADTLELSRRDLNRLGGNIGKLEGYGYIPQAHDAYRLLKTSKGAWVDAIMARLDLEKTFPELDAKGAQAVLDDIYQTATTGQRREAGARERGERLGPRNLATALGQERVLHFKSADDWLAYNREFGYADPLASIISHLRHSARTAGQMKVLGPNPEVMLQAMAAAEARKLRDVKGAQKQIDDLANITRWGDYKVLTGAAFGIYGPRIAKAGQLIRSWESMSKLGGVVISSITDPVTLASNLRFQGRGVVQSYGRVFGNYFRGRGAGESRRVAFMLGEGFDGIVDNLVTPYAAMDTAAGKASRAMSFFFRLSGLTWFTDTGRSVGARLMAADMGRLAGKGFDQLDIRYRNVLELQGIDAARWDVIRKAAWEGSNGVRYVTPDGIRDLPDEAFAGLVPAGTKPERMAHAIEQARADLELDLHRFYADEVTSGIIESDARTQAVTTWGGLPRGKEHLGAGELARMVMQFKAFPIAFGQRVLGRRLHSGPAYATKAEAILRNSLHMGELLATLWVAGLLASWGKDLAKGKTPKELWGDEGLNWKTVAAAFLQSGGLGIYGDFLFAEKNRFGGTWVENLSGPAIGDIITFGDLMLRLRDVVKNGDLDNAWAKDAFRLVEGTVPFANLFQVKAGLDFLFINSIKEALSPGYLRRQERRARQDYGQSYWLPRTAF